MKTKTQQFSGRLILVVGPSGAGKDSLINGAAKQLQDEDVYFPRRIVTRDADKNLEDHDSLTREEFDARVESNNNSFPLFWYAHGLGYALPFSIDDELEAGKTVIANVSRSVLQYAHDTYPNLIIINVTARPEILAERLKNRGRETADDIERRLKRAKAELPAGFPIIDIDNSGNLTEGITRFVFAVKN